MFVEHKEAGEQTERGREQQVRPKLSEAIRAGAEIIPEYFGTLCDKGACAIGAAYIALGGDRRKWGASYEIKRYVADKTGAPLEAVERAWERHARTYGKGAGDVRLRVADWVEAQGY